MNAKLKLVIIRAARTALQTATGLLATQAFTEWNVSAVQGLVVTVVVSFLAALQNGIEQYFGTSEG